MRASDSRDVREGIRQGKDGVQIRFQRGYWDKLSFLRLHGLPIPGA
jgi:hypothetical protein